MLAHAGIRARKCSLSGRKKSPPIFEKFAGPCFIHHPSIMLEKKASSMKMPKRCVAKHGPPKHVGE